MRRSSLGILADIRTGCLSVLLCLSLLGCAATPKIVAVEKRIPLVSSGSASGSFKTGSLSMEYSYTREGQSISVSGEAYYQWKLDKLNISLMFVDASGKEISSIYIYSSGFRSGEDSEKSDKFSKSNMAIPAGAEAISFDYIAYEKTGHRN